jgi:hypothetical protein
LIVSKNTAKFVDKKLLENLVERYELLLDCVILEKQKDKNLEDFKKFARIS